MSRFDEPDRLLRLIVAQRGVCERCHRARGTEVAHIIRRRFTAVRWVETNVWWLCHFDHQLVDTAEVEFKALVASTIGHLHRDVLRNIAQAGPPEPLSMWQRSETARLRDRCSALGIPTRRAS